MTVPFEKIKRLGGPSGISEALHQVIQGATPLVLWGEIQSDPAELLELLGWRVVDLSRLGRSYMVVTLAGERGQVEVCCRSGQVIGGVSVPRGRQPQRLSWREVETTLRHDGHYNPEDRCEPIGRMIEAISRGVVLEITGGDGGEP